MLALAHSATPVILAKSPLAQPVLILTAIPLTTVLDARRTQQEPAPSVTHVVVDRFWQRISCPVLTPPVEPTAIAVAVLPTVTEPPPFVVFV